MYTVRMANLLADVQDAAVGKAKQMARAKAEGASEILHEFGYGQTPFASFLVVLEWVRENPRPQGGMAFNPERKAWTAKAEAELLVALEALQ